MTTVNVADTGKANTTTVADRAKSQRPQVGADAGTETIDGNEAFDGLLGSCPLP